MLRRFFVDERTLLRPIAESDPQPLYEAVDRNRAHLRRYLPWLDSTRSPKDIEAFRVRSLAQEREGLGMARVIEHAAAISGVVSFNHIDLFNRRAELGYWIDRTLEGRGICRQACTQLIRHAFEELDLNRISIAAAVENRRSRALAERLGFTFEGVRREAEWLYDRFVDHATYGLLRREWREP
ncbi:MAG TPA: GNAT family protein [Polyangiales bacterium]|nr:GNAT family protein [Polyangiales bacterium]